MDSKQTKDNKTCKKGVSVAICCHNSAKVLPDTLNYIKKQNVPKNISWEVIVVDNGSADNTAEVAQQCWLKDAPASLKVVSAPQIGLVYARYKAFEESRYEFISFIDDDNWVNPDWVKIIFEVMTKHPFVGACGSFVEPVFESEPPEWFESCKNAYAVGPQGKPGDITEAKGRLVGAGLTIRKDAWQQLINLGFSNMLIGHKGKSLSRGEDTELCYALRLAGWKLWYEPGLRLKHYLSSDRLQWRHLRRLRRGGGRASVAFDAYFAALNKNDRVKFKQDWKSQALVVMMSLSSQPIKLFSSFFPALEGNKEVLLIEKNIGRLLELLKKRKEYNKSFEKIDGIFI